MSPTILHCGAVSSCQTVSCQLWDCTALLAGFCEWCNFNVDLYSASPLNYLLQCALQQLPRRETFSLSTDLSPQSDSHRTKTHKRSFCIGDSNPKIPVEREHVLHSCPCTTNIKKTRSSADADNGLDAFVGQSRSTNISGPFQVK